ncbi:MAG: Tex-like N-terminal domain-containing protein, partial [Bacteroidaceae bacterium]
MTNVNDIISKNLNIPITGVSNTIMLLDDGCTIPFISRYRKERTGSLDEVQITDISVMYDKLKELIKRKETVVITIEEQGKLTSELSKKIDECWNAN